MKDEIKELLNRFEFVKKEPNKLSYYPEDLLTREEMWLLYDYITNLQEENERLKIDNKRLQHNEKVFKSRNEKANTLLDEMLERAYIDGEYIMYDYSTSELLEVKQALQGEDKDE